MGRIEMVRLKMEKELCLMMLKLKNQETVSPNGGRLDWESAEEVGRMRERESASRPIDQKSCPKALTSFKDIRQAIAFIRTPREASDSLQRNGNGILLGQIRRAEIGTSKIPFQLAFAFS